MNASNVAERIYKHFWNYEYKLFNTYVFDWESDFFAISKSSYVVEVEIKVSRSDFKADFKKEKHHLFESLRAGKKINVQRRDSSWAHGDLLIKNFAEKRLYVDRQQVDASKELKEHHWIRSTDKPHMQKQYVVNDWGFDRVQLRTHRIYDVYAPVSRIAYQVLAETKIPHQFYYAVPAGLLQLSEIPAYAGLIYVTDGGCEIIKKAPYMHKNKMDLRSELLSKFYHLWLNRVDYKNKIQLFVDNETNAA